MCFSVTCGLVLHSNILSLCDCGSVNFCILVFYFDNVLCLYTILCFLFVCVDSEYDYNTMLTTVSSFFAILSSMSACFVHTLLLI